MTAGRINQVYEYAQVATCKPALGDVPHWHMAWHQGTRTLGNQHLSTAVIYSNLIRIPRNVDQAEPTHNAFTHCVSWTPSLNAGTLQCTESVQPAYTASTRHSMHNFPIGAFQTTATFIPTEAHACLDGIKLTTCKTSVAWNSKWISMENQKPQFKIHPLGCHFAMWPWNSNQINQSEPQCNNQSEPQSPNQSGHQYPKSIRPPMSPNPNFVLPDRFLHSYPTFLITLFISCIKCFFAKLCFSNLPNKLSNKFGCCYTRKHIEVAV